MVESRARDKMKTPIATFNNAYGYICLKHFCPVLTVDSFEFPETASSGYELEFELNIK